ALHVNADGSRLYPTRKVKAVDTTAAGDCFNGAFVVGLSEGMSAAEAIRFANIASSITVTRAGAQQSIPTREETDSVLAKTEVEKA
ncbi:MAG: PfkB family carbohydrate kinase, partial [Angelakisella sp.]